MSENKNGLTGKSGMRHFLSGHASEISIATALLIICVILSFCSPYFLQIRNLKNILSYVSIAGVMSAGLTVVMLMGCMDLSQYAVMAMIGMFIASMMKQGLHPFLAIVIALLMGAAVGALNAFTVTKMHIVPIIATIGMQLICRSIAYLSTGGIYIMVDNDIFYNIGYKEIAAALAGEMSMDEAVALLKQATRNYAKRQLTWFRRDPRVEWVCADGLSAADIAAEIEEKTKVWLNTEGESTAL